MDADESFARCNRQTPVIYIQWKQTALNSRNFIVKESSSVSRLVSVSIHKNALIPFKCQLIIPQSRFLD